MRFALLILLITGIGLAGCKHTQPSEPLPATIEQTTATMKAEIQQAIVSLKGGIPPLISDSVFMNSSTLLLESGLSDQSILGINSLSVQTFQLQKRDIGCVLLALKTHQYVLLKSVPCQAVIK
jgi:hypothetical protein